MIHNRAGRLLAKTVVGLGLVTAPLAYAYASVSVSIQSLSPSTSVSVGTPVSFTVAASGFTNQTYGISDSLVSSSIGAGNITTSGNFSWTPTANDVGTHTLTIALNDATGDSATTTETLQVSAAPTVSIQSLSPSSAVSVGQTVSFLAVVSGLANPTYSVSDSLNGSTVSTGNINSSGNFSWTPTSQDAGTHTLTITARDASGNSVSAQEQLTVSAAAMVVIQSLSASSAQEGQNVSFTAVTSGFSNPTYTLSDTFSGTSLSSADINSSGSFNWTPTVNDAGTHTITVTASDGSGHTATASQTLVVSGASIVLQGLSPGTALVSGNPLTFTAYASGFTSPVYTVSDSFGGSTVSNAVINSASGYFNWTPTTNDVGTHQITVYAKDSYGHNALITQQIVVEVPNITITSVSPSSSINYGSTVTFSLIQEGFTNPTYTLSDSFSNSSISNANINSSGNFSWTPGVNQVGTHTIMVYATDSAGHSANTSITLYVNSNANVSMTPPSPSADIAPGTPIMSIAYANGFSSPSYSVSDTFPNSSIASRNINTLGTLTWTPSESDIGTHSITVTATDSDGHTGSANVQIVVSGAPVAVAAQSGYVFTSYLCLGLTSDEVMQLQTKLTKLGYFWLNGKM